MKHFGNKSFKGFTLIELLVVVAIIGILAAVGVVAYNGYTGAAKVAYTKSNHKLVSNYVRNEVKKCEMGETNIMIKDNISLKCLNLNSSTIINYMAATNNSPLADLKNIYYENSNQAAQRKFIREHNSYVANYTWRDTDLGASWFAPKSNSEIVVRTCFKLPCTTSANRLETNLFVY